MWEEGAWENRLWMQIWALDSLRTGASPSPAAARLQALPGRQRFEGSAAGPASGAELRFIGCQHAPASHGPPRSQRPVAAHQAHPA